METKTASAKNTITVLHLYESTTYLFQVLPECEAGVGLESALSVPITTKMIIPSKPGKPRAKSVTFNGIELEWTKPEQGAHNVTSYTIFYYSTIDPKDTWSTHEFKVVSKEEIIIRQLPDNTTYWFKIRSECESGFGSESDISEPITTRMIIPGKPGKPKATNATHDSIQLEWTKPQQGAHNITSYTICYRSTEDPPDHWIEQKSAATEEKWILSELLEFTHYLFKVRPECETGIGLESDTSDPIQTKMIIPSKPGKPKFLAVTHHHVLLEWSKPERGTHNITSYTIFYRCTTNDSHAYGVWEDCKIVTREKAIVSQLSENTIYQFKIRPECKAGFGFESDISEPIRTKIMIPSQPGKPQCLKVSHNSIQLEWSKPQQGAHNIIAYRIFYRSDDDIDSPSGWIEQKLEGNNENVTILHLLERQTYFFKVQPEYAEHMGLMSDISDHIGLMSDISEPITTKMIIPSKPGKPRAAQVTHNSIELEWTKPEQGAHNVTMYSLFYCVVSDTDIADCHSPDQWREQTCPTESSTVCNLTAEAAYIFKVHAHSEIGESEDSETSDPISTKPSLALKLKKESQCLKQTEGLDIYKLPLTSLTPADHSHVFAKYCMGAPQDLSTAYPERVLILVGATGSGKSTLIDGITNYIMGVKLEDNFRYKLIAEEISQGQAHSQTQAITAYSFPVFQESPLPYNLTVIDTPGFGSTRGLERDEQITAQIKRFFSLGNSDGIDHVDGIGFVVQSAIAQLTTTQMFMVDTILAVFGKDIANNIFIITTFVDGTYPPAMDSIKTHIQRANPPIPLDIDEMQVFKFNNSESALFIGSNKMYWEMGYTSFYDLFNHLGQAKPQTLKLTNSVLDEQKTLQILIQSVLRHMYNGANSIKELHHTIEAWKHSEAKVKAENFTYEVPSKRYEEGTYIVNCSKCIQICLPSWTTRHGDIRWLCPVMDSSGFCTVCPGQCHYTDHEIKPSNKFVYYEETETRTDHELEEKYRKANQDKANIEQLITEIKQKVLDAYQRVCICFNQVQHSVERLEKRALRLNPLTDLDYVNVLIEAEKQEKNLGWEKRITCYEKARESAEIIHHAKKGKIPKHMNLEGIVNDLLSDIPI